MLWPDKDIYEGIRKGNRAIFDSVFKEYYSGLCILAKDYVKSVDIAEEIVQEVFFNLWENHHKIHIKSSLKAYLYRCVHNLCINYLRQNNPQTKNSVQFEELENLSDLHFIEIEDHIFDIAYNEKLEQEFEKAIESLPEQCKNIFHMSRYENIPYPEIAKRLNISLSTVKTQMSRAMNKLRNIMDEYL